MFRKILLFIACTWKAMLNAGNTEDVARKEVNLQAPDFSPKNYLGAKVGVRPYRRSGVRIEKENFNEKVIIHNYGYGGSGLTLCWGGAQEVATLLKDVQVHSNKKVAILGAGVVGLSTAYELSSLGYNVSIYADKFSPNLTSDVAAGIWSPPSIEGLPKAQQEMLSRMLDVSTKRYEEIARSSMPEFCGVRHIDEYNFSKPDQQNLDMFGSLFENGCEQVSVGFNNGMQRVGMKYEVLSLDGKTFMKDLFEKVKNKCSKIVVSKFVEKEQLLNLEEDVIINCTSIGSEKLFEDKDFIPIRGHLLKFKNTKNIKYSTYESITCKDFVMWLTLYPLGDELLICGTWEEGESDLKVDPSIEEKLLNYAREKFDIRSSIKSNISQ